MFDLADHIAYRAARARAADIANARLPGLTTVEVNPTELCNRRCSFCPRSDPAVYPNRDLHMRVETAAKLADDLGAARFGGDIHITGFGEPLLHPALDALVAALRARLPGRHIEITTNGDRLTPERLGALHRAGADRFIVDCYDGPEELARREAVLRAAMPDEGAYRLRAHFDDPAEPVAGMIARYGFTNRSGAAAPPPRQPLRRPCHLPFYKLFVDWNGDVLLCCNDWLRRHDPLGNVHERAIDEIWRGEGFARVRGELAAANRCGPACRNCDIDGTRVGADSVRVLTQGGKDR